MPVADEDLVRRLRAGDMEAFDTLYTRYERRLFGYVQRLGPDPARAEDIFQDVFFTVLTDRTYQPDKGRFAAWLFTVARHRCHEELRRAERRRKQNQLVAAGSSTSTDGPEILHETRRGVHAAMSSLDEHHRQLLLLKQVGELTYKEIATLLGVAEGTIKSRMHEAMKHFRARLLQQEKAEEG